MANRMTAGMIAGCIATVPMTLVMHVLHRWPAPERAPLPPHQITEEIAERVAEGVGAQEHLDQPRLRALTLASHFGFGAAAGALYGLIFPSLPGRAPLKGVIWGLMVWAVSYAGWIPAAQILPPASEQPKRRNGLMIVAHLVWGVVTALLAEPKASDS